MVFDGNDCRTAELKNLYGWTSRLTHVNGARVFLKIPSNSIENHSQIWQDTFNDSERRPLTKGQRGSSERQAMEGLLGSLLTGTSPPGAVGGLRERRMRAMRTRRSFFCCSSVSLTKRGALHSGRTPRFRWCVGRQVGGGLVCGFLNLANGGCKPQQAV